MSRLRFSFTHGVDEARGAGFGGTRRLQFRAEAFNFLNHPNLGRVVADPTNASFGRVVSKTGQRDIQLSLRFQF